MYVVNTWYYTHNAEEIILPNNKFGASQNTPDLIMVWSLFDLLDKYSAIYLKIYDDGRNPLMIDSKDILEQYNVQANTETLTKMQFRIYYTPLGESVKLQVPKTTPQATQFCIPYSQQQPIVDSTTLGREMQSVANRAGCETKQVVRTKQ